jgi:3-oxoacyl-[acyl-carrier-protein] synthase-3
LQDSEASGDASFANVAMAGQDVFKFAVRSVPAVIEAALEQAGLEKEQVDWLVMHQANQRILDAAATRLGLPAERVSRAGWNQAGSDCMTV